MRGLSDSRSTPRSSRRDKRGAQRKYPAQGQSATATQARPPTLGGREPSEGLEPRLWPHPPDDPSCGAGPMDRPGLPRDRFAGRQIVERPATVIGAERLAAPCTPRGPTPSQLPAPCAREPHSIAHGLGCFAQFYAGPAKLEARPGGLDSALLEGLLGRPRLPGGEAPEVQMESVQARSRPGMSVLQLTQPEGIELGLAANSSFERPGLRREDLWASS